MHGLLFLHFSVLVTTRSVKCFVSDFSFGVQTKRHKNKRVAYNMWMS
jgi:hypothetical protein